MIAQRFEFTRDFPKAWNNSVYFQLRKMSSGFKDQARFCPSGEKCGLDGLNFRGAVGPDGKPKDIPDLFFFANGSFLSRECEFRCEYPAGPYFVRQIGSKTEFISEIKYPYRDAKIVWRGTIEGDKITGKSTWIVKRWYWTVENTFEFEGKLQKEPLTTASTD